MEIAEANGGLDLEEIIKAAREAATTRSKDWILKQIRGAGSSEKETQEVHGDGSATNPAGSEVTPPETKKRQRNTSRGAKKRDKKETGEPAEAATPGPSKKANTSNVAPTWKDPDPAPDARKSALAEGPVVRAQLSLVKEWVVPLTVGAKAARDLRISARTPSKPRPGDAVVPAFKTGGAGGGTADGAWVSARSNTSSDAPLRSSRPPRCRGTDSEAPKTNAGEKGGNEGRSNLDRGLLNRGLPHRSGCRKTGKEDLDFLGGLLSSPPPDCGGRIRPGTNNAPTTGPLLHFRPNASGGAGVEVRPALSTSGAKEEKGECAQGLGGPGP
ncbi:hypothetical protein NDU88_008929 [Pleurodeles waltl]|uniref:Uncharacterized protein n=1 Tax=Pleurodeles waltl TaxID=8319 RepID=A0AAV7RXM3_PLEWA|nr:hypothetical protein NDU88_008929 [Pleurodeles waltl]